jgi:DNA-binding transcriptional ArsR family regulator
MSVQDLLSEQPPADPDPERRTVDAAADGEVLEALATDTARRVAAALHDSPGTASEVAAETDISLQSVGYHLDRLQEVGLVEVVGTRYSSKAKEMDVYAPTSAPIVVQFGEGDARN